ncbi:hypothetical protein F5Y16DRAFT_341821 [Xylariaceae sp. FL0255]|nr:hypothetical protein F5Y16DRAFT_341821 [Xylariaceae sp. FL0255]
MSQGKDRLKPSTRDPPPSLFLNPSRDASHVSLSGSSSNLTTNPPNHNSGSNMSTHPSQVPPPLSQTASFLNPRSRTVPRLQTGESTRTADKTDALWAEMQATLEEAELSASGGTHVFGPDHDRKLAELRAAQIALAQAWARSEADDGANITSTETEVRNLKGALGDAGGVGAAVGATAAGVTLGSAAAPNATGKGATDGTEGGKSTIGSASVPPGGAGLDGEKLGAKLEEETERDILLARNRREANDRYFSKVDQGVRDVVAKLEEVAISMRAVEQETRGIWGEESAPESIDV